MSSSLRWFWLAVAGCVVAICVAAFYVGLDDPRDGKSASGPSSPARSVIPATSNVSVSPPGSAAATEGGSTANAGKPGVASLLLSRCLACLANKSEDERHKEFLELVDRMTKEDAPALRDALVKFADQGIWHEFEWGIFWRKWGRIDQEAALTFLSTNAKAQWAGKGYTSVLRGWAESAPEAALRWIKENESNARIGDAMIGFVQGRVATDPKQATEMVMTMMNQGSPLTSRAINDIIDGIHRASFAEGLASWFDNLPREGQGIEFRRLAVDGVHQRMLQKNVETAAAWTAAQASTPWRVDAHIKEVALQWSQKDPASAMKWATSLPLSPEHGHIVGIGTIVNAWASSNPAQVEAWLEEVRGTQAFEQGARDYAIAIAKKDRDLANRWANQVVDEKLRADTLAIVARGGL